jgi:hypothetical protein
MAAMVSANRCMTAASEEEARAVSRERGDKKLSLAFAKSSANSGVAVITKTL